MKKTTKQVVRILNQQINDLETENQTAKDAYARAYNRRVKRVSQLKKLVDELEAENLTGQQKAIRRLARIIEPPMRSA